MAELKFSVYLYYRLTLLNGLLLELKQYSPLAGIHHIFVLIAQ